MTGKFLAFLFMFLLCLGPVTSFSSDEISPEELERWFNSDSMEPPRYKDSRRVNEGNLVFLSQEPEGALHHHHNSVTISPASLNDGWILIEQCHSNIDRVPAAQIVFSKSRVKNIQIVSYQNIEKAWVEDASVQFENVKDEATICIQANTRSLMQLPDGSYKLRNGPFMRRFLDGYFPLHVSLDLNYGQTDLVLTSFSPTIQEGFDVKQREGKISIDTVFEGRLHTEFHFKTKEL
ncbi:MAG: alpha/beta hydrolase [Thioalkalispiraceae bacterium]|jgi:hypothetical protein